MGNLFRAGILLLLAILQLLGSPLPTSATSSVSSYWTADGGFDLSSQTPYSAKFQEFQVHYAPWGSSGWTIGASGDYPNGTYGPVDAAAFNVTSGIAHAWVYENRRIVDARSGTAGFEEGVSRVGEGAIPPQIPVIGRDTVLAYRIMRENTSISNSPSSIDEDGILFDLLIQTTYPVNGSSLTSTLVVDFYVNQECGGLVGGCSQTNDTGTNHRIVGHTHFFEWRIHPNLQERTWVSDIVNLRWYLENSVHRTYCHDVVGSDDCSLPTPQAMLFGLTSTAEAFGGSSGFALDYEYLYQADDCEMGLSSGNDFNHPLRIGNVQPGQIVEVNGWLGSGYLLNDSNDYYQFNISAPYLNGNSTVGVTEEGAESIWLYSPGNPPILKDYVENTSRGSAGFTHATTNTDSAGYWYLRIHRSSGFGPYTFRLGLNVPTTTNQPSIAATCSLGSPLPPIETSWQVIALFGVVTALIVVVERIATRKPEGS